VSLRLLVVTNMWPTERDPAFGVFVRDQVEALRLAGADCTVLFVDGKTRTLAYLGAIYDCRRRLRAIGPDVVIAHHVLSGLIVWLAGRARPRPRWILIHHGIEVFCGWQAPLARWLTGRADRTLVVSSAMARHLRLSSEDVLPMGVDTSLFLPMDRADARRRLGLPSGPALVAWIGSDRPEKRLDLARRAVEVLRDSRPDADLLVVAGVDHATVPLWLGACDVVLLTSCCEGSPTVVKEALACDRPVVSTNVGDVADLLTGLEGCRVVSDARPESLAGALKQALDAGPVHTRCAVLPLDVADLAGRMIHIASSVAAEGAAALPAAAGTSARPGPER
jgi:glycosyltransferase involved in cell wall biosynthesis